MSKSVRRVERAASDLGLDINVRRTGESTRTAEDAALACGCDVPQIVKSLIFRGCETVDLILLLVSGANQVDMDLAPDAVGEHLERADAAEVRARTGFAIGGVAPIGHLETPRILLDETLLQVSTVWAAAGAPDAVFEVPPDVLARATKAKVARFAKINPQ
ncbi:MAG: YbaK/EbsC family protein [Pseudomonadota bacterium]